MCSTFVLLDSLSHILGVVAMRRREGRKYDVAFHKGKNLIATVSHAIYIRIYDATTGNLTGIYNLHNYSIKLLN